MKNYQVATVTSITGTLIALFVLSLILQEHRRAIVALDTRLDYIEAWVVFLFNEQKAPLSISTISPIAAAEIDVPVLSPHFKSSEFACKCCNSINISVGIDPVLISKLEQLRTVLGNSPITIISGYRCPKHNKEVGGVINSQHLLGKAADVQVKGKTPAQVAKAAEKINFGFIKQYSTFVHVDVRK